VPRPAAPVSSSHVAPVGAGDDPAEGDNGTEALARVTSKGDGVAIVGVVAAQQHCHLGWVGCQNHPLAERAQGLRCDCAARNGHRVEHHDRVVREHTQGGLDDSPGGLRI